MSTVTIHIAVEAYAGFARKYGCNARNPKTGHAIIEKSVAAIKGHFPKGTKFVMSNYVSAKYVAGV